MLVKIAVWHLYYYCSNPNNQIQIHVLCAWMCTTLGGDRISLSCTFSHAFYEFFVASWKTGQRNSACFLADDQGALRQADFFPRFGMEPKPQKEKHPLRVLKQCSCDWKKSSPSNIARNSFQKLWPKPRTPFADCFVKCYHFSQLFGLF